MSDPIKTKPSDSEEEIWNAIAAFEKILEAMPNNRISLETLADAYEKVGDRTRAQDYLLRLANVLVEEQDEDAAHDLLGKLNACDQTDPQVSEIIERIERIEPEKVRAVILDDQKPPMRRSVNIAAEISFAWNLLQAGKLPQEEYSNIVHDLSENSAKTTGSPISTLHVLHDRNYPGLSEIMGFTSESCNIPIISLSNFDLPDDIGRLLPLDFVIQRGALIFETMGTDSLVAIMNPYDDQLSMDIEGITGKPCFLYLVAPYDFDNALNKIKGQFAAQKVAETP
ncbi:MAG: hypothetical protein ABR497_11670 [Kiritimatiellia bacterium]|nr:hypothetical protein [Lentisphaerota bacterium]